MRTKLYIFLSFVMMMIVGCSDSNNDKEEPLPQPVYKKGYVSRIKVTDMDNPESEVKTIKIYYDMNRTVTGVHWGTTVPGRVAWKFVYGDNRIDFKFSGDAEESVRYCTIDADGKASDMYFKSLNKSLHTVYSYDDKNHLVQLTERSTEGPGYKLTADFTWNTYGIVATDTKICTNDRDSIKVSSSVLYDEFAPNSANINLNVVLDAVNGITPLYTDAPILLNKCGTAPSQLVFRHNRCELNELYPEKNNDISYQVMNYSVQQGRITTVETENKNKGTHYKLDIIYKAD